MQDLQNTLIIDGAIILIFIILELVHKYLHVIADITRKIAHISVGLLLIVLQFKIHNHWFVGASCLFFLVLFWYTKRSNKLQSIHRVQRSTYGDYLFVIIIYLSYVILQHYQFKAYFWLPLLILTISDPLAFFAGTFWYNNKNKTKAIINPKKTVVGSIAFFISAIITSYFFLLYSADFSVRHIIFIAVITGILTTFTEYISGKGWDNLSVPVTTAGILIVYLEFIL